MTPDTPRPGFSTRAIHAGQEADPTTGATIVPIYATSTYTQEAPGKHKGYEYSRSGNPTRKALETCLAALEEGERGLAFASGSAATAAVLAQLKPGDEVAAAADLYGGTYRLLERVFRPWGLATRYTDDPSPAGFAAIVTPKTKLVWVESPTNPLLQILDIAAIADVAHKAGAVLAVDNTFASPYLQQPLKLGADLVVHSTTKYLGGHSDVVGGAVIGRAELLKPIRFYQNAAGGTPGPFDSYLTLRGMKTLAVRMERHCANARRLAAWLAEQPQVERVYYPGLPQHPGHEQANSWVNIDHHASNPRYGDLNYLDLTAPATGQIVFDLVQDQGYPLNREIAEALFVAISTDTGSFRYRNTSGHTFEVVAELVRRGVDIADISHYLYERQPKRRVLLLRALLQHTHFYANDQIGTMALTLEKKTELGIQPADTDGLIDVVRSIETVIVAVLFEELGNNRVRVSMRSKNTGIDVNKICGEFGGGGHPLAAGARIRGTLEDVENKIADRVSNEIARLH